MIREKATFQQGMMAAIPIVVGYLPISITFGAVCGQSGVLLIYSVLMSLLVFAGASQFMTINMLTIGAGPLEVILATLVLNFRHFVMGLSLMNILKEEPKRWKVILSSGITDETFAVASLQQEKVTRFFVAGLMLTSYTAWVLVSNIIWPMCYDH